MNLEECDLWRFGYADFRGDWSNLRVRKPKSGVSYDRPRLHKQGYFTDLLANNEEISDSIRPLVKLSMEHRCAAKDA